MLLNREFYPRLSPEFGLLPTRIPCLNWPCCASNACWRTQSLAILSDLTHPGVNHQEELAAADIILSVLLRNRVGLRCEPGAKCVGFVPIAARAPLSVSPHTILSAFGTQPISVLHLRCIPSRQFEHSCTAEYASDPEISWWLDIAASSDHPQLLPVL